MSDELSAERIRELVAQSDRDANPVSLDLYLRWHASAIADALDERDRLRKVAQTVVDRWDSQVRDPRALAANELRALGEQA